MAIAVVRGGMPEAAKPTVDLIQQNILSLASSKTSSESRLPASAPSATTARSSGVSGFASPCKSKPAHPQPAGPPGLRLVDNDGCRALWRKASGARLGILRSGRTEELGAA
jgi:hypothetical protein